MIGWELASFLLLGLALIAGFVWYERTRPSAKVVALVATLAGLAALGRVAFAALPDIKPMTDIVLLAGYVLGGAPGFAVGAVGALASNFFFGQGTWTPWQMLAWGVIGLGGAGLGRLTGRRLGRVPLTIACGVAGLVFGLILNFSTWVTFSGDLTLDHYLVISGSALPFDLAHVIGNVFFCLAFGPAFVRALLRFRARLSVRWVPVGAVVLVLALVLGVAPLALAAAGSGSLAPEVGYLVGAQNADGGFGGAKGQPSTEIYTAWAVIGLAAAGRDPRKVVRGGRSPVTYMLAQARTLTGIGDVERTVLALGAAGAPVPRPMASRLGAGEAADGSFGHLVNLTSFGILALRAAGRPVGDRGVRHALGWLARQQNADGGFNFAGRGSQSGIDDTADALEGLVAGGARPGGRAAQRAAGFLAARQNPDGGYPLTPGGESNAQSTAFAIQGLLAAHRDPGRLPHGSALGYLRSLAGRGGSVRYSPRSAQTPVWVTAQALAALAGRPLPIRRGG
ncbi:MAG: energy-coupling factor transport system substrate-specific component [Solirubrobacteraceae bacterium]|nr:energy-coupling factor transport system substrate-specific component [Solirubrobacteraceae bacterium]